MYKKETFFVIFITLTMSVIPAFTTPTVSVLAVKMDDDLSIDAAIRTLEQNTPGIHVVEYGSFEYNLLLWRSINPTIWISHGSEEGFKLNGEICDWSNLEKPIRTTKNKDIILSCHSDSLIKQTSLTDKDVITFNSAVDAELGALLVSYALTNNNGIINKIKSRIETVIYSPKSYTPLALSGIELGYWTVMTIVTLLMILLDVYMDPEWNIIQQTAIKLIVIGKVGIITTLCWLAQGWISFTSAIADMIGFIVDVVEYLIQFFYAASWWEKLIYGACIIGGLIILAAELTATAGQSAWWKLFAASVTIIALAANVAADWIDGDGGRYDIVG